MKQLLIAVVMLLLAAPGFARSRHHRPLPKDSLIEIAAEVSQTFYPEFKISKKHVKISGPFLFRRGYDYSEGGYEESMFRDLDKNNGREYYKVFFLNTDKSTNKDYPEISEVQIWADNLEPQGVDWRVGNMLGRTFIFVSFEEQKKNLLEGKDPTYVFRTHLPTKNESSASLSLQTPLS